MRMSEEASGALRTFAYFMWSGNHYMLADVDYTSLCGSEPSAFEQVFAIYANTLEWDPDTGQVLIGHYAQARATDYLRQHMTPGYRVDPPYEEWETALHFPPPRNDAASTPESRAYIERLAAKRAT